MTEKIKHILHLVVLIVLIAAGLFVFGYYIMASELVDYQSLPLTFLLIVMLYIGGQLAKRFLQVKSPWYGWLYYIGLIAIVAPLPLIGLAEKNVVLVTRFGSLFLILPPLIEFAMLVKKKEKQELPSEHDAPEEPVAPALEEDVNNDTNNY